MYAGAGLIWGAVVFTRGMRVLRDSHRFPDPFVPSFTQIEVSFSLLGGALLSVTCSVYLFFFLIHQ